jgi:hypothetical protein
LPDFFTRALLYLFSQRRYHLRVDGMHHLPQDGSAILVTNSGRFDVCVHVLEATDRYVHFYLPDRPVGDGLSQFLRLLSRLTSTTTLPPTGSRQEELESALGTLRDGNLVGLPFESVEDSMGESSFFRLVRSKSDVPIIPVYCDVHQPSKHPDAGTTNRRQAKVAFGEALPPDASGEEIRSAFARLHS